MRKLFTLLLAVAASVGTMFAEKVQIGDLYYYLDATSKTAEVTSQKSGKYSGDIVITSSVTYNSVSYSVTSIGESAFGECTGLTSVTIPNSVTSIGDMAFIRCSGLTSVTIPNSVTSIRSHAFYRCTGLTSVTIPNSVTSIGDNAFVYCDGLTSIEIPNSVTSIGNNAFSYCTGLTSIIIENGNSFYDSRNNCNAIIETATNTLIVGCMNTIIPNSVTSIGDVAFIRCSGLTSVTIPNSVTSIGESAFDGCSSLTSVTIPNSVTSISYKAFFYCTGLTSINVASDNSNYCSVDGVLFNKDKTTLIQYPGGKQGAYIIPNSVTSIGDVAFYRCSGLTSVTIPNSVTSIGRYAFGECTGLTSVTCLATTPPMMGDNVFYNVNRSQIPLYVPAESVEAYQTADQWKDFTNIIGLDDGDVEESNIRYIDPSNNELGSETVSLHLPDVPEIEGFIFLKWQVVAGDLEEGIIIQAVYQADESTSASSVYANPANPAQKLIRNGNVYILSNEKTYSITGQEVIVP